MNKECAAPAPATQRVNREEVRMLVADLGYDETSKRTGIKQGTLRQWAKRFAWSKPFVHSQAVTTVTCSPADAHAEALAEMESQTRVGLAKFARQAVGQINKSVHPAKYTTEAHNVAKTAAIVHRWDAKSENSQNVVVNVALLGVQPHEVSATVLDVDSEGQGSGD